MHEIMIVDDDTAVANYLMVFLTQSEIYHPTVVTDPNEVLEMLRIQQFDAMILDLDMPGMSGFDLLKEFQRQDLVMPVVVLSGINDVELAVRSLKLGAFDYLSKPVEDQLLLDVLRKAITTRTLQSSIERLPSRLSRGDLDHEEVFARLKTRNPKMIRIFHQVERMAAGNLNIFIHGELGTGRRTLARVIHEASPRRDHPFVAVNAASHDPEQFAAMLFGVARGWQGDSEGRTGFIEQAHLGTMFIANIGRMTKPAQRRLDRLIRTEEYYREGSTEVQQIDIRLITASSRDLTRDTYDATFSRQLLYRLRTNVVNLPPLRLLPDDIPLLAEHFLAREAREAGRGAMFLDPELAKLLQGYHYPGNHEELRDIIAISVRKVEGDTMTIASLPHYILRRLRMGREEVGGFIPHSLREATREHVARTVKFLDGDRSVASEKLGISPSEVDAILPEDETK
jgi:DNA-binding NtrC family response regulator